jgi:hypothetical protein
LVLLRKMSSDPQDGDGFDGPFDVGEHAQGLDYGDVEDWPAQAPVIATAVVPEDPMYADVMTWDVTRVQRWAEAVVGECRYSCTVMNSGQCIHKTSC